MRDEIINAVRQSFASDEVQKVLDNLNSITLKDVMAESESNLNNTYLAILKLSKGNLQELIRFTKCAKKDFRDVIYWASLE